MTTGRVVRIFDKRRVVIDLGSDHGIAAGTTIHIMSPGTQIHDVDGDEVLGEYRLHKATAVAREVYPRFCVAMPPNRRRRIDPEATPQVGSLASLLRSTPKYETVPGAFNVDASEIDPLEGGSELAVGDIAEPVLEVEEAPAEDSAAENAESDAG